MSLIPDVPDELVTKVLGLLTDGRSCAIGIVNQTAATLTWDAANTSTSHGGLLPPPPQIAANSADVAGAQSGDNSIATGCEGVIAYTVDDGTGSFGIRLHYDNPFAGGNSADAESDSSAYAVDAGAGPGDQKAPVRFALRAAS